MDSLDTSLMLTSSTYSLMPEKDLVHTINHVIIRDSCMFLENSKNFKISVSQLHEALNKLVSVLINRPITSQTISKFMNDTIDQLVVERNIYGLFLQCFDVDEYVNANEKSSNSVRDDLLFNNPEFRTLFTLLKWSESVAEDTLDGFASGLNLLDQMIKLDNVLGNTILEVKNGQKPITSLSTDLRFKNDGLFLNSKDLENIQDMIKLIVGFIRCGRIDEALQLVIQTKFACMHSLLKVKKYVQDPTLSSSESKQLKFLSSFKSRDFTKFVAQSFLDKDFSTYTDMDKVLFASVSGELKSLLKYSTTFNDKLWSLLSTAVDARFDEALEINFGYKSKLKRNVEKAMTVDSIFESLEKNDIDDYYGLVKYIVTEQFSKCIEFMYGKIKDSKSGKVTLGKLIHPNTVRMYANLAILFKKFDIEMDLKMADEIISSYIDILKDLKENKYIPYYLSTLSCDIQEEEAKLFLSEIANEDDRKILLKYCKKYGMDTRTICLLLCNKTDNSFDSSLSDTDIENKITSWLWLLDGGNDTLVEALEEGCKLLRWLLINKKDFYWEKVLKALPDNIVYDIEKLNIKLDNKEKNDDINLEFLSFKLFDSICTKYQYWSDCFEKTCGTFEKLSNEDLSKLSFVDRENYQRELFEFETETAKWKEESSRAKDIFINEVNMALNFPKGWFTSRINDNSRVDELKKIRSICLYRTFKMLLECHIVSNDYNGTITILHKLTESKRQFIKELDIEDREDLFRSARNYVGSLPDIFKE
ncbi:Nuclear pore complex protein Nup107 [Strongyloides ratti]|uniref:Nuclear pore complex protein n=1 Tax=Strongyloides ratti TaxID=34506 RepID=A0A090LBI8_STRRB|nr:Nuclear pore complex protein Nup107 [Strongyloides ratti]CEF67131.1 Nuclear pore complex protein Nup107 [Strongyloides ratti]